ncbi:dihydroorotase family protein, partial [Candidatus Saccharibacteria bacterium]|nr:dihydroorotase family protein [Candidatus Saccharibacteria bacterium]
GVCSEHTPHSLSEKQGNVWQVAAGMPNIQESIPALITGWLKNFGQDSLEECLVRLAQVTSYNIAMIFGFKNKGGIALNKDADLAIIDTKSKWHVKQSDLFTKNRWSAYEGKRLVGRPIATFLRGSLVYENGKVIGEPKGQHQAKS